MTLPSLTNRPAPDALKTVLGRLSGVEESFVSDDVVLTQFPSVDRVLGGGLRKGDLTVLGGDAGVGSSALALGIALRVSPRPVLLSGEYRSTRMWERAIAISARVPLESLHFGTLTAEEHARVAISSSELEEWGPAIGTISEAGVSQVEAAIDRSPKTTLVIVDGIEALLARDSDLDAAAAGVMLELKRMALRRNVVILALAHLPALDRSRKDLRPRLQDFGGAGAVGTHADVVLGLYREELYDADPALTGAAELLVLKHREAPRGYADLYFTPTDLRFEDILDQ